MEVLAAERATSEYHSFLAAAPQLLPQLCTDRMGGQDTGTGLLTPVLQRPSANLSSQEEIGFLSTEILALLQKRWVTYCNPSSIGTGGALYWTLCSQKERERK